MIGRGVDDLRLNRLPTMNTNFNDLASLGSTLPLGAAALALVMAMLASAVSWWAGQQARGIHRISAAAAGALIATAAIGVWAHAVHWNVSEQLLGAAALGSLCLQTVLAWLMARWRQLPRRRRSTSTARAALMPALAGLLSWAALGSTLAAPTLDAPGAQALLGALVLALVGLGLHAQASQRTSVAALRPALRSSFDSSHFA